MRVLTPLLVFSLTFASPGFSEDSLVVIDGSGQVLGPVVDLSYYSGNGPQAVFILRQGLEYGVLRKEGTSRVRTVHLPPNDSRYFYFGPVGCTDTPLGIQPLPTSDVPALFPYVDDLYKVDADQTIQVTASFRRESAYSGPNPYPCEALTPQLVSVNPITFWSTLTFVPPLQVILNPLIFSDGFGTSDTSRWNQTTP